MNYEEQRQQVESIIGRNFTVSMLSPCVGGVLRTWTWIDGEEVSNAFYVLEADRLRELQGVGAISRVPEGPDGWGTGMGNVFQPVGTVGRYREVAFLSADGNQLIIQPRVPDKVEPSERGTQIDIPAQIFQLEPFRSPGPATTPKQVWEELRQIFDRAIWSAVRTNEVLSIELGGWQSRRLPFCQFILMAEDEELIVTIEAEPQPLESDVWAVGIRPNQLSASVRSSADRETIDVASIFLMETLPSWRVNPWDIALTFGVLPTGTIYTPS